ncbi:hypothetical protein LEMLEM_LOCUS16732 [Lemmus lemmus]
MQQTVNFHFKERRLSFGEWSPPSPHCQETFLCKQTEIITENFRRSKFGVEEPSPNGYIEVQLLDLSFVVHCGGRGGKMSLMEAL